MLAYIARRVLLMIPTLFGIMLISFVLVQFAPGGPVERMIAQLQGQESGVAGRLGGGGGDVAGGAPASGGAGGDVTSARWGFARTGSRVFVGQGPFGLGAKVSTHREHCSDGVELASFPSSGL